MKYNRLSTVKIIKLGVLLYSGREVNALLNDASWINDSNLVCITHEIINASTLPTFVYLGNTCFMTHQLERLGALTHEDYRQQNRYSEADPGHKLWNKQLKDFKESNLQQIVYAVEILRTEGYILEKAIGKITLPAFNANEIERMAELEHWRRVIEQLSSGLIYGPIDADRKISPYLCPWENTPDNIKAYS